MDWCQTLTLDAAFPDLVGTDAYSSELLLDSRSTDMPLLDVFFAFRKLSNEFLNKLYFANRGAGLTSYLLGTHSLLEHHDYSLVTSRD